jgi:hypothetical protein
MLSADFAAGKIASVSTRHCSGATGALGGIGIRATKAFIWTSPISRADE